MKRDRVIGVRVSGAEQEQIERLAAQEGRPVGDWIRRRLLGEDVAPDGRRRPATVEITPGHRVTIVELREALDAHARPERAIEAGVVERLPLGDGAWVCACGHPMALHRPDPSAGDPDWHYCSGAAPDGPCPCRILPARRS